MATRSGGGPVPRRGSLASLSLVPPSQLRHSNAQLSWLDSLPLSLSLSMLNGCQTKKKDGYFLPQLYRLQLPQAHMLFSFSFKDAAAFIQEIWFSVCFHYTNLYSPLYFLTSTLFFIYIIITESILLLSGIPFPVEFHISLPPLNVIFFWLDNTDKCFLLPGKNVNAHILIFPFIMWDKVPD